MTFNDVSDYNVNTRSITQLATWNVRGLLQPGKLQILENELIRCNVKIAGIAEMHWRGNGHFRTAHCTIYFSVLENESRAGTPIMVSNKLNTTVVGYDTINERILSYGSTLRHVQ